MELTITHESDWEPFGDDGSSELVIGPYRATVTISRNRAGYAAGIDATVRIPGAPAIAQCKDVADSIHAAQEWCESIIEEHAQ